MRRWLVWVFLAGAAMITVAFVAPLAVLIRSTGEDRAIDAARADASSVLPVLAVSDSPVQIEAAIAATQSGAAGQMSVVLFDGTSLGPDVSASPAVADAVTTGASAVADVSGGKEVVTAVANGRGELAAVRVFVPSDALREGQSQAWTALGLVALLLTGLSVLIADRLARTIVRPTEDLADAAVRLGAGDFGARVLPAGPRELVELGETFNELGERISESMSRERELLAELSHRLRTPLTPLRMRIDRVESEALASDLRADVDELTGIVNELINEARRGASRPRSTRCDAAVVVAERVEFWSVLAEDQGRKWRFRRQADRAPVSLDGEELSAAVDVLLENVFAHTDEGVALEVGVSTGADGVRISVSDAGPGIDPRHVPAGSSGGGSTGLGLHIAGRTAARVGGELVIEPGLLDGATVTLVLPLATDV